MRVKICGFTEPVTLTTAAAAGADFLGLVLAPSARRVTPAAARRLISCARSLRNHIKMVGVFVNTPAARVNRLADYCDLDYVQLSGDEGLAYCRSINRPIIKVIHVSNQNTEAVLDDIENALALNLPGFTIMLDRGQKQEYGGTGQTFDWQVAREMARCYPIMVAGGLNAFNVAGMVRQVHPWGVDVSTGVETNGIKDEAKIITFIQEAKHALTNCSTDHDQLIDEV